MSTSKPFIHKSGGGNAAYYNGSVTSLQEAMPRYQAIVLAQPEKRLAGSNRR